MKNAYEKLAVKYEEGRITATGFVIDSLNTVDRDDLKEALEALPSDLSELVRDFVQHYGADAQVFRGPPPDPGALIIGRDLLAKPVRTA
jgi:hypothetical protein